MFFLYYIQICHCQYNCQAIYFRLAVNNMQYLSNVLGVKDPIHKQKIALKAMDVVLFGPPKGVYSIKYYIILYQDVTMFVSKLIMFNYINRRWT